MSHCLYFYGVSTLEFLFLTLLKVLELFTLLKLHSFPQSILIQACTSSLSAWISLA